MGAPPLSVIVPPPLAPYLEIVETTEVAEIVGVKMLGATYLFCLLNMIRCPLERKAVRRRNIRRWIFFILVFRMNELQLLYESNPH
jgi:hypothetical protein